MGVCNNINQLVWESPTSFFLHDVGPFFIQIFFLNPVLFQNSFHTFICTWEDSYENTDVEDEKEMLNSMASSLKEEKYLIETAESFSDAMEKIGVYNYDCILLDISLPDGNGLEILKALKSQNKTEGLIIVSAKNSLDDKVKGLDLGADDYLAKPFHMAELHARVKAVFKD